MKLYETIFIARQDMAPSQVDTLTEKFSTIIREYKGTIGKTEYCGLRQLAYPIKKSNKGHYVLMNITCDFDGIKEMERQMHLNEDILRYMTVNVDAHHDGPSSLLKAARNSNLRDISISFSENGDNPEQDSNKEE